MGGSKALVLEDVNKAQNAQVIQAKDRHREGFSGILSPRSAFLLNDASYVSVLKKPAGPPAGNSSNGGEGDGQRNGIIRRHVGVAVHIL